MHTQNTFVQMRSSRSSAAAKSVQNHTFDTLKSLVNMHGVDLSVYSY